MTDWAGGIEKRNYGIQGGNGVATRDLLRWMLVILPVVAVLLFHLWVRNQTTRVGYAAQKLAEQVEELQREKSNLVVLEESLQRPDEIEKIARNRLGMVPMQTGQLLGVLAPVADAGRTAIALAMER